MLSFFTPIIYTPITDLTNALKIFCSLRLSFSNRTLRDSLVEVKVFALINEIVIVYSPLIR